MDPEYEESKIRFERTRRERLRRDEIIGLNGPIKGVRKVSRRQLRTGWANKRPLPGQQSDVQVGLNGLIEGIKVERLPKKASDSENNTTVEEGENTTQEDSEPESTERTTEEKQRPLLQRKERKEDPVNNY